MNLSMDNGSFCQCSGPSQVVTGGIATVGNPVMKYDGTLGTPNAQGIVPPFTNLPAQIYDFNGVQNGYGWNTETGLWV